MLVIIFSKIIPSGNVLRSRIMDVSCPSSFLQVISTWHDPTLVKSSIEVANRTAGSGIDWGADTVSDLEIF